MRKGIIALGIVIIAALTVATPGTADDSLTRVSIDPTIAQKAPLVKCLTAAQLDCIERVLVRHPDGSVEEAQYVTTRFVPFPDENGQKVVYGDVIFDFKVESSKGPLRRLRISTHVITPTGTFNGKNAGAYWLMLQREPLPYEKIAAGGTCTPTTPIGCISYPALDTDDEFHVYMRTSWLKPVAAGGQATNFNMDYRKVKNGIQWHFSGGEFLQSVFRDSSKLTLSALPGNETMQPDVLNPTLYFVLDHAGTDLSNSYWDPKCADFGFTRTMSNAPMAGQLFWDYGTQSLNLNVYGPHLNVLGERNTGAFYTKFQKAWLDCRFPGNTLSTATKIVVQVINDNGTPQVATSSVSIKEGTIELSVYGFHFSSPTIKASRAADAGSSQVRKVFYQDDWQNDISNLLPGAVTQPVAVKKRTITCTKGKVTRKVTAVNPQCPKGFTKK